MIVAGVGMAIPQRDYSIKIPESLEPRCSRASRDHPEATAALVLGVFVEPWSFLHIPPMASDAQPQPAGLTCKQAAFAGGRATCAPSATLPGKSALAKPSAVPCQVENHLLLQAQGQFERAQMGCSGHSYVVKFPFQGALDVMGNLKCQTAVHFLVWDGTVPKPCNAYNAPLTGQLGGGTQAIWEMWHVLP